MGVVTRPTVGLACIMKNEDKNISVLLQSVRGCFDQIVIVDTGSTDNSVEFLKKINEHIRNKNPDWSGLPEIQIEHFEWVYDFSKARNYSFSFLKTDYGCWLDLDDELIGRVEFAHWRDNLMHAAHYWIANYQYAFDDKGVCQCEFVRERVVKLNYGFEWQYFVHEGILKSDGGNFWAQKVSSWHVKHRRTEEDRKQDYLRNIDIINKYKDQGELPPRMLFYQGKELMENGFHKEACEPLLKAIASPSLDIHDRLLSIQYAAQSAIASQAWDQAVDLLTNGLKIMISRAEYWCMLGDVYCNINKIPEAIQCFEVALTCKPNNLNGTTVIYRHAYDAYPKQKLCEIYTAMADYDNASKFLAYLKEIEHHSAPELETKINVMKDYSTPKTNLIESQDVIITCPPQAIVTDWDENSLKAKGHGGSETAAIEVARWIKKKTNRNVRIFHPRARRETMDSGVEYIPSSELAGYLHTVKPYAHIAWRHAVRLTNAKSYVWCHDLQLPYGDMHGNYDKVVALSEFHKNYLTEVSHVPAEKIVIGFNGINPDDFPKERPVKDPLKVVFSSSPDRGLVEAIDVVKKAREISGLDIKLHCFYGTDNMRKSGQNAWADQIEAHIKLHENFVVYHGMVKKQELMRHFGEAGVWLYINNFLETYCITAIEALVAHTWPIVRAIAALPYTLKEAIEKNSCDMITREATGVEAIDLWANTLVDAIKEKKWERMDFSADKYSWEHVADFFIKEFGL